jgi:hypothetical protein
MCSTASFSFLDDDQSTCSPSVYPLSPPCSPITPTSCPSVVPPSFTNDMWPLEMIYELRCRLLYTKLLAMTVKDASFATNPIAIRMNEYMDQHFARIALLMISSHESSVIETNLKLTWEQLRSELNFLDCCYLFNFDSSCTLKYTSENEMNQALVTHLNNVLYFGEPERFITQDALDQLYYIRDCMERTQTRRFLQPIQLPTEEPLRNPFILLKTFFITNVIEDIKQIIEQWCLSLFAIQERVNHTASEMVGEHYPDTLFQLCICEYGLKKWIEQMKIQYRSTFMTPWQICVKNFVTWKQDNVKQSKSNIYQSVLRDYLVTIHYTEKSRHHRQQDRYNHWSLFTKEKPYKAAKIVKPTKAKQVGPPLVDSRLHKISPGVFQLSINTSNNGIEYVGIHQ